MIKLIATDLDDTILPEGTFDLNPEYYEVIRELKKKGILFAASSGFLLLLGMTWRSWRAMAPW